jgi:hypothetical protein
MSQTYKPERSPSKHNLASDRLPDLPRSIAGSGNKPSDVSTQNGGDPNLPTIQTLLSPEDPTSRSHRLSGDPLLNHSPEWMAAIGRIGGLSKSPAKSRAARLNGAKGGRPRKSDPRVDVADDKKPDLVRITAGQHVPANAGSLSDAN